MRIASWNVNSVRARLHNILDWLSNLEIDVILIQEIKCVEEQFPRLEFEALGYEAAINGQKSYNGVAILSKSPITEVKNGLPNYLEDEQSRYIEAKIKGVVFASIYLPNG
ncbi:MAG: exodeoxyribonuclease III, partial [Pseudomonadota bacterium]|nr:exodeoxyribonuclease III [Pseudomonadota bacterium]